MILTCDFDRTIDSWVLSGKPAGAAGEASLVLSDVRISVDVVDPSRIVEIAVFCDPEGQITAESLEYLHLLLGNSFGPLSHAAEIEVDVVNLPVFQASRIAQTVALMEVENDDFRLRRLDIVQFAQSLGGHARELLDGYLWELLPAVTGLGHVLVSDPSLLDWWPTAARKALHERASIYLDALKTKAVEAELLEDVEWLAYLSAPAPEDASALSAELALTPSPAGSGSAATRSAQSEMHGPKNSHIDPSIAHFDEPEAYRPRLGGDAALFGRGPILLEINGAGALSIVRIPLKSGVSTAELLNIRLRLVEKDAYRLIHEAQLESVVDPATGLTMAVASFRLGVTDPGSLLLDLSNVRLPVINKSTRTFLLRHKATVSARRALVAERSGERAHSEELWRLCRQSMQFMGVPTSDIDTSRNIFKARLTSSPDWLAPIVNGWAAYVENTVSTEEPANEHRQALERALHNVYAGLGEGPNLARLCLAYASALIAAHPKSGQLNDDDHELAKASLHQALTLFRIEGNNARIDECVDLLSILR